MKEIFVLPKFDGNGNKIFNKAGDLVSTEFVYNFNEMGMDRKLMAQRYFELAEKQIENAPNTHEQINMIAARQLEAKAFSAMLIRVLDDGKYELYEPEVTQLSKYELSELGKTEEEWARLKAVQADFFQKIGVTSKKQMRELVDSMMPLMLLVNKLKSEGIEVKSNSELNEILKIVSPNFES